MNAIQQVLRVTLLLLIVLAQTTVAQDTTYSYGECISKVGVGVQVATTPTIVQIRGLDGIPNCCSNYTTGTGNMVGATAEYQVAISSLLNAGARLGVQAIKNNLLAQEFRTILNNGINEQVHINHSINTQHMYILAMPFVEYRGISFLPMQCGVALRKSIQTSFQQSEQIVSPSEITFENDRRDRLNFTGSIPSLSQIRLDATASISYVLPLSQHNTWSLIPRIEASYPLNSVVQNGTWNIATIGIGLSLYKNTYQTTMHVTEPPVKPVEPPATTQVATSSNLSAQVSMYSSTNNRITSIAVQSKATVSAFPLLPYIFFDDSSSVLPERYIALTNQETSAFTYRTLDNMPDLDRYRHTLNIIGKRLQEYPKLTIVVRGCNSNINSEAGNISLSSSRATTVKEYLVKVWNVDEKRIKSEARNLPIQFSNTKSADGIEENRRVEIIPSSMELYFPVITNDTTYVSSVSDINVKTKVQSDEEITSWNLQCKQGNTVLWSKQGSGAVPENHQISMTDTTIPKNNTNAILSLTVTNIKGRVVSALDTIIVAVIEDTSVSRKQFTLVLFDYNSAELTPLNIKVAEMVRKQLQQNSQVTITGFADRTGELEYNQKLAIRRGEALARTLRLTNTTVTAYDGTLLINNELPEGRYFCRTVRVVIEDKR